MYKTVLVAGPATEMFTWVEDNDTLKRYGYRIESNALIVN
jgi:hypothetical protein